MSASIRFMSVAEEQEWRSAKGNRRFSVASIAEYLGCTPQLVRAAMRRMRMKPVSKLARGQAAAVILHIREREGDKILKELDPGRKITFLG